LTHRIAGYTIIPSDTKVTGNSSFIVMIKVLNMKIIFRGRLVGYAEKNRGKREDLTLLAGEDTWRCQDLGR
jgi:hypothetical protein